MTSQPERFVIVNSGRSGRTLLVDVIHVMDRGRVVESGTHAE